MKAANHGPLEISRRRVMLGGIAVAACTSLGLPREASSLAPVAPLGGTAPLDFAQAHISDYLIAL